MPSRAIRSNGDATLIRHVGWTSNRERDDRTPHAEQYHLLVEEPRFTIMHPFRMAFMAPLLLRCSRSHGRFVYEELTVGPLAPLGAPVWNPMLNLRLTVLRYRMRPVPVVFLRLAFSPQLTVLC